jgi:8-oxo-dGTP pyrophosphatase MutT (NUDIX family)
MAEMLSLDRVREALADGQYRRLSGAADLHQAAVAGILRAGAESAELLFIHRAEDPRDRWSGHMAFPGGRVDAGDADAFSAALRETREEIGLDLTRDAEALGRLSDVNAVARGKRQGMVIFPFVFALIGEPELVTNSEVQEVVWVPLAYFAERRHRSIMHWSYEGVDIPLPCYRYQGHLIWGLTLSMVDDLMERLGVELL